MKIPTAITDPPVEQRVSESVSETGGSDAAAVPAASACGSGTVLEPEPVEVEEENGEPQGKRKHTFFKKDELAELCKPCRRKKKLVLGGRRSHMMI